MAKSKITLGQVEPVMEACGVALNSAGTFGTRIKLREALRSLDVHAQDFNTERKTLVEKYSEKSEDGEPVVVDGMVQFGDNKEEVERLWADLVATTVTVTHKLTMEDVCGLPGDAALDPLELLLA